MNSVDEQKVINTKNFLMEHEGAAILKQFHLPIVKSQLVQSVEEASKAARVIGYPVVLKGMAREITHKTEAGIVKINIMNETELRESYTEILLNAKNYDEKAQLAGILVQKMAPKGIELIVGVKRDLIFGHQLVVGYGGTMVEVMKDYSMRMLPVSRQEVDEMISSLKTAPILQGYRGEAGINISCLYDICEGINCLVEKLPEIEELDLNPIIFSADQAFICDVRILQSEVQVGTKMSRSSLELEGMINPRSIAVIGASQNEAKNGGRLLKYIVTNCFDGDVYPVNPLATEILGYKAYASLLEIPYSVDLACIIVAAKFVPDVMRECLQKGIKNVIIYSSGFAEIGDEGKELQEEVMEIARKGKINVLGPNSIGLASPSKNIYTAFGAALEAKEKIAGGIGFLSQSGAMGSALLSRAWENNIGFSRWVSIANEADLTISDFIKVLSADDITKVISVFMEGIKDAKAFEQATQEAVESQKPVLVYKTGRSDIGKKAVQSHTGSMAGDDAVYEAAFEKYNVIRVENVEDLVDVAAAFEIQPIPKGKRIGIVTASGGACSVVSDLCSLAGLEVAPFTTNAEKIKQLIPTFGSGQNPVDVTAEIISNPEMFKQVLDAVISDEGIDGVLVMLTTNSDPGAFIIAKAIYELFEKYDKPIVLGRLGSATIAQKAMAYYREKGFIVYQNPEKIVNVMKYLVKYSEILSRKSLYERKNGWK